MEDEGMAAMGEKQVVDARGVACPEPVVRTRRAMLDENTVEIEALLTSDVSAENVRRLAAAMKWEVAGEEKEAGEIRLRLKRSVAASTEAVEVELLACDVPGSSVAVDDSHAPQPSQPGPTAATVVMITSKTFGSGDEKLGKLLMHAFIKTLKETGRRPARLMFANEGIFFTTEGSDLLDDLHEIETRGVEILTCGTCLDYHRLGDKLKVGRSTNMFEIAETLLEAGKVIRF